jgi:type IV pilus assembly protein PilB
LRVTHKELIKQVAKQTDLTPDEVAILWRELSQVMTKQLQERSKIRIKNFGAFVVVKHKSRTVPDPRERSKKLVIFDQHLPKFRPSEQLRAKVKDILPNHAAMSEDESELETVSPTVDETAVAETTTVAAKETIEEATTPVKETGTIKDKESSSDEPKSDEPTDEPVKKKHSKTDKLDASIQSLSKSVNIGYIDLSTLTIDKEVLELIPAHIAQKYQLVAIEKTDDKLIVAMIDPGDREAIDIVERQTGLTIEPKITTSSELQHALDQYGADASALSSITGEEMTETDPAAQQEAMQDAESNDAPAAKAVNTILERAVRDKASDIHIEPTDKVVVVRYRIDGILQQVMELPKAIQSALVSRLKIMSSLKIDESRLPQDGRLRIILDRHPVDFRLSTLPTVNGEKVVMRILDEASGMLTFEDLGLRGENLRRIEDNITKSHGMLLVTGPTGSGKTTTLYSAIGKIISPEINIITVEDPVEYRISGINQSQVNAGIGYDFASGLRSIVRQDPDVILIGEIRDLETATMAIHSALTGHVVLSTLHTNDAAGAVPRLIDMGIEPFLITSSTNVVLAQRLVRRICDECKEAIEFPEEALKEVYEEIEKIPEEHRKKIDTAKLTFSKGKGCSRCNNSGYKGRLGIYEALVVTESIKQLALKRVSSSELAEQAIKEGMITMKQDGILKVLDGITTLEEVWRVTKD